ncbi:MAG: PLP-dependent aminotransferase family protein [Lachnospiraceae bacterium]|nr:PLP-dependent aminotransferase family protein [Lachnospiraceae bacterium]
MNYRIEKDSGIPAYLQLYHCFVKDIVAGVYPYGSRLPSKRTIAAETGVSVITADHALTLLNEEGYAESRQRSGVFVSYRGEEFPGAEHLQENAGETEKNAPGELHGPEIPEDAETDAQDTGEFPFSVLARTMRKVLLDYGERILIKSPNHGCPELREEICRYLARSRGISVEPSRVILGSGAEYLYGLIAQFLGSGQTVALEKPSYEKIRKVYEAMGLHCEFLTMTPEGISGRELKNCSAKVLHVTPFNSFPSGVTAGISKKLEYLRWAKERGGILIEDNYDSELTVSRKQEDALFSMDPEAQVVYLNTFSRTLAPSARAAYMLLPSSLAEAFHEKLGFYSCTLPIFDQYVLAELLKNGELERHINRIRRKRRERR